MHTYVISDLHIGAGALDDCDAGCEAALVAFVDHLTDSREEQVELVLNGDSFDFVQAEPWKRPDLEARTSDKVPLCFTEVISCEKAQAILDSHPKIFDSFARFVARAGAALTIMPGNHDADLFWPKVRGAFEQRLNGSIRARVRWHLEPQYIPPTAPQLWIEHGHQYDPVNSFFHPVPKPPVALWSEARPPILASEHGELRLLECIGTRFLIRFLNELDLRYPFVDNMKPFSRFLKIFWSSISNLRGGSVRAAMTALAFARYTTAEAIVAPSNLLSMDLENGSLPEMLKAIDRDSGYGLDVTLRKAGFDFRAPSLQAALQNTMRSNENAVRILEFSLEHLDLLDGLELGGRSLGIGREGRSAGDHNLSLLRGGGIDETAALRRGAEDVLTRFSGCVVMGHTHEAVDNPRYKNTGSWTRYWQMVAGDRIPSWPEMVARSDTLPLSPHYVLATSEPRSVSMHDFA
nr:metallophosphoesterase [Variovorax paradoxus]